VTCPSEPLDSVDDPGGDPGLWCALEKLENAAELATRVHDAVERARGHLRAVELLAVLDDVQEQGASMIHGSMPACTSCSAMLTKRCRRSRLQPPDHGLLLIVTVTWPDDGMAQDASVARLAHTLQQVAPPLLWIVVGTKNRTATARPIYARWNGNGHASETASVPRTSSLPKFQVHPIEQWACMELPGLVQISQY